MYTATSLSHFFVRTESDVVSGCYASQRLKGSSTLASKSRPCLRVAYAAKMNFYMTVVDDRLRHKADAPFIGLILLNEVPRQHQLVEARCY